MSLIESAGGVLDRQQRILLKAFWGDIRYEYDSMDRLIYEGGNIAHKALTSDTGWAIWKHTWDGINKVRTEGPLEGAWDSKEILDWA